MKMRRYCLVLMTLTLFSSGSLLYAVGTNLGGTLNNGGCSSASASGGGASNVSSVNLNLPIGRFQKSFVVQSAALVIEEHQPSLKLPTPEALHLSIGNYAILSASTVGDVKKWTVLRNNGELLYFTTTPNGNVGTTGDGTETIVDNSVFYQINTEDGDYYQFDSTTLDMIGVRKDGLYQELSALNLAIVRDSNDILKQVKSASRLNNIVTDNDYKYHIDIYPAEVVVYNETTKLYEWSGAQPMETWTIEAPEAPGNLNKIRITQHNNSTTHTYNYTYNTSKDEWSMSADGGITIESVSQELSTGNNTKLVTKTVLKNGLINEKHVTIRATDRDWGEPVLEEQSYSSATQVLKTFYEYYENENDYGYKKKKLMRRTDGYWEIYVYDSAGRLARKIESWLDDNYADTYVYNNPGATGPACYTIGKVTDYNYTTHVSEPEGYAQKPHTITVSVRGTVIEKTFYAYPNYGISQRDEIEEKCLDKDAIFAIDDTSIDNPDHNLLTRKRYFTDVYAVKVDKAKLEFIRYPDGTVDYYQRFQGRYNVGDHTFENSNDNGAWAERVVKLVVNGDSFEPTTGKTIVNDRVWDEYGNEVLNETHVQIKDPGFLYSSQNWALYTTEFKRIGWKVMNYDDLGHANHTYYSDGTEESGYWGTGCCGKDNDTDRYGIYTSYHYDAYKRMDAMTRNGVTTTYLLDGKGRRLTTTRSGDGLTLSSSKQYDWRGRVTLSKDESGLPTSTVYNDTARTETTTYPGGGTRIVTRFRDGRIKSITGTAQVAEHYTYGVNTADGSTWTRVDVAYASTDSTVTDSDRRWEKTTYDMVGRTKKIEKPAYGTTDALFEENFYNNKGQLWKKVTGVGGTVQQTMLYEYDELGTLKLQGLVANSAAQTLNKASADRIIGFEEVYAKETVGSEDIWFQKKTTNIYPYEGANAGDAKAASIQKTQLTGLGKEDLTGSYTDAGKLVSKVITTDIYGQHTTRYTYVKLNDGDPNNGSEQKVTQVAAVQTSSQDAIVITKNGLKKSEISTTGVETSFVYDGLGRLRTQTVFSDADLNGSNEREVSSTYTYYGFGTGSRGQVQSIQDNAGNLTLYTYYSNTGKPQSETRHASLGNGSANLVENGDFEAGNVGFSTGYDYVNVSPPWPPSGKYGIDDNAKDWHGGLYSIMDHTSGNGLMFVANGDVVPNTVWEQSVDVVAGKTYTFEAWAAILYTDNAQFGFFVNGESVGTLDIVQGGWLKFSGEWAASASGSVVLSIRNLSEGFFEGYALDDIAFHDGSYQTLTTTYTYDNATRKLNKLEGAQYPVEYHYDGYGQLDWMKTWRDEDNSSTAATTTWHYDPATGLLTQKEYADSNGPTYDYYSDGKLKSRTWERPKAGTTTPIKTRYSYHNSGELASIDYYDDTVFDFEYSYDRLGRLSGVDEYQGPNLDDRSYNFTYDPQGRLDTETLKIGASEKYKIDRSPNGATDPFGRDKGFQLFLNGSSTAAQTITYGYENATSANGRFKSVAFSIDGKSDTFTYSWADGVDLLTGYSSAGASPAASVTYGYEDNRDLKTDVLNQSKGARVSQYGYTYDEVGRRKTRDDTFKELSAVGRSFLYNNRSEVVGADLDGSTGFEDVYDYDDIGNRLTSSSLSESLAYAPNSLNQYDTITTNSIQPQQTASFDYDDDGNLENDGVWTYEWDAENQLIAMEKINKVDGARRLEFKYDFMGRRYQKDVFVYASGSFPATPNTTTAFIYDGWNLIQEKVTDHSPSPALPITRSYVWGLDLSQTLQGAGGVGGLLCSVRSVDGSSAPFYAMADANGNITDYVGAAGNRIAHFEYDAFGQVVTTESPVPDGFPIRFSSKYEDVETGMNYYGYRYYSAGLGRWLNRDPIEENGGINVYQFCGNNGVNYWDYLGEIKVDHDPGIIYGEPIFVDFEKDGHGDDVGGATRIGNHQVKCELNDCNSYGRYTIKKCTVSWRAHIRLNKNYNGYWGGNARTIIGHERGHYLSWIDRIYKVVVTALEKKDGPSRSSIEDAKKDMENLEIAYYKILYDLTSNPKTKVQDQAGHGYRMIDGKKVNGPFPHAPRSGLEFPENLGEFERIDEFPKR